MLLHDWPEDTLVRLHFSNDGEGTALRPSSIDDRRRELKSIFQTVARDHPDATAVRGTSWLYHLQAYRRLFPPTFVAGLSSVGYPHQFAALWCQFIDRHGVVKPGIAAAFVAEIDIANTREQLDAAFPLDVLAATSDIGISTNTSASIARATGRTAADQGGCDRARRGCDPLHE